MVDAHAAHQKREAHALLQKERKSLQTTIKLAVAADLVMMFTQIAVRGFLSSCKRSAGLVATCMPRKNAAHIISEHAVVSLLWENL